MCQSTHPEPLGGSADGVLRRAGFVMVTLHWAFCTKFRSGAFARMVVSHPPCSDQDLYRLTTGAPKNLPWVRQSKRC